MSENLKGTIFMMCSMNFFSVNNGMIKAFGGVVPMFQTVALRGGIVLLLLGLVVVRSGWNVQKLGRQAILARNIIFCGFGFFVARGCGAFFEPWRDVSLESWVLLTRSSVSVFFGYIVSVLAIRMGKVSFTSQSSYSGLLVTLVLGYIFSKSGRIPGR